MKRLGNSLKMQASGLDTDGSHSHRYPGSRGPLIFLDKSGRGRDLPLPNFSRKIEKASAQRVSHRPLSQVKNLKVGTWASGAVVS